MLKEIWIEDANHIQGTLDSVHSHLFEHLGYSALQMWRVKFYIRGCFLLGPRQETGNKHEIEPLSINPYVSGLSCDRSSWRMFSSVIQPMLGWFPIFTALLHVSHAAFGIWIFKFIKIRTRTCGDSLYERCSLLLFYPEIKFLGPCLKFRLPILLLGFVSCSGHRHYQSTWINP